MLDSSVIVSYYQYMDTTTYQLPDGRLVNVDATAAKGAIVIGFTLAGGRIVEAVRVDGEVVGMVTDQDVPLCRACLDVPELASFRVGTPETPITHPAPDGRTTHDRRSVRYGEACGMCGWSIRRAD